MIDGIGKKTYFSLGVCKSYFRSTACTTKSAKWLCPRYFAVCCPERTLIKHICHYMFMSDLIRIS